MAKKPKFHAVLHGEDEKAIRKGKAVLKKMSPDKFLSEAEPLDGSSGDKRIIDTFEDDIEDGDTLGALRLYKKGQDGRHRAKAAKKLGVKNVNVVDYRKKKDEGGSVNDEGDVLKDFTVGGQKYSSVNPKMDSPNLEKAVTWALDKAARAASYLDAGTPARIYKEAVLDRRQQPFTEKDFNEEELKSLAKAIVKSQAEGRDNIQYEDYSGGPFPVVIGRANYNLDKAGNAVVNDTYDFNNYEKYGSKKWPTDFYSASTWLGRRALPSGVRGVPVSVNVPKEMMEEALSSAAQEPEQKQYGGEIKEAIRVCRQSGGPVLPLGDDDPNAAFRRLISWSFAVAPLFNRADGGAVEDMAAHEADEKAVIDLALEVLAKYADTKEIDDSSRSIIDQAFEVISQLPNNENN